MTESEMIQNPDVIKFPRLGIEFEIDPTAFSIFGLSVQWYGVIIATGLLLAILYCFPRMKKFGVDADKAVDAVIGGVIGGVVGARLYFVLNKWDDYKKDSFGETFRAIINIRNGGLAIYGGIIGAMIVGLTICRIKKIKILPMLDIGVMGFLIGQGVGRWGNFVNQEAFGTNTENIFGMTGGRIQHIINNSMQIGGEMYESGLEMMWEKPVHPCFLYESVWCLLGFALLAFFYRYRKYDGQLLLFYLAWYGAERAVVEGLRTDSLTIGSSNLRISQLLSVVILVSSVIIQIVMISRVKRDPERYALYVTTEEGRKILGETPDEETETKKDDNISILSDDSEDDDDNFKEE